jgi:hypothetical protein
MRDVVWNQLVKPTVEIISGAVRKKINQWLTSFSTYRRADCEPVVHTLRGKAGAPIP